MCCNFVNISYLDPKFLQYALYILCFLNMKKNRFFEAQTLDYILNNSKKLLTNWNKNCSTKKPVPLFFSQNWFVNFSEYISIFSDFSLIFEIFFLILKNWLKVTKFGYIFTKRLRTILKKFLGNRSKRFANTTQTFFDKRGFQKLEKNLKKFLCILTNWQIDFGWK